jgi:hypothetical protein
MAFVPRGTFPFWALQYILFHVEQRFVTSLPSSPRPRAGFSRQFRSKLVASKKERRGYSKRFYW